MRERIGPLRPVLVNGNGEIACYLDEPEAPEDPAQTGPWEAGVDKEKDNFVDGYDWLICDRNGYRVAEVTNYYGRAELHAKLIAAAPDLLDALIMVRDADNDAKSDGFPGIPYAARSKIDAAIARAIGAA